MKHPLLFLLLIWSSSMLLGQKERDLSYKEVPVLTSAQWQSFEMKDDEDTGLLIYDKDRDMFVQYNGERWIELTDGGDVHGALARNKDMLSLRQSYLNNIEKSAKKNAHQVPKLKKKRRRALQVTEEDKGLILFDGNFQLYNGKQWVELGDGGNFDNLMNRQKNIVGLKDDYMSNWKRSYGIGLYFGRVYSSFFRDEKYPSNPFINGLADGWEFGINQNLIYQKFFQSRFYLGYQTYGVSETFVGTDRTVVANWKFNGAKASILPIMLTPGTRDIKLVIGAGAYARYNFSNEFSVDGFNGEVLTSTEDIERFEYGFQGQLGLQVHRFFLDINAYNQYNHLFSSFETPRFLDRRFIQTKSYTLTLTYNF